MDIMGKKVLLYVSSMTGISEKDIRSRSRKKRFVMARCLISQLLRKVGWGVELVGELLNKDHSTVVYYGTKLHPKFMREYQHYRTEYEKLRKSVDVSSKSVSATKEIDMHRTQMEWHARQLKKIEETLIGDNQ